MLPKKFVRAALWAETHTILKKLRFITDKSLAALMHEAALGLEQRHMAQQIAQQAEAGAEAPRARLAATQQIPPRSATATAPQPTTAA